MFKIVAAPSPRGTNREKLFVPAKLFPKGMAFDEAPAEEPKKRGGDVEAFLKALAGMTSEGRDLLLDALSKHFHKAADDEEDSPDLEHIKLGIAKANDKPSAFKGRPKLGGAMDAASGAQNSFAERYPEAVLIKTKPTSSKSFEERFPDAMKIKVYL
jgi:hypothetical protein